jgi:FkbM family methyltransferase
MKAEGPAFASSAKDTSLPAPPNPKPTAPQRQGAARAWAQFERDHLARFFEHFRVDCVLDVGANAGQYADVIRREVGFAGPIISFEPVPQLAAMLRTKAEADPHWHIRELALDREVRDAVFHVAAANEFSSLKTSSHADTRRFARLNTAVQKVPLRTSTLAVELPRLQSELGFRRPFLKLDTQGNDIEVVEGAGEAIARFVGLQSELAFRRLYENASYFDEALRVYAAKGFVLSALVPNNAGHFPDLVEMDCIMYRKDFQE